jgi:hypothetical protein
MHPQRGRLLFSQNVFDESLQLPQPLRRYRIGRGNCSASERNQTYETVFDRWCSVKHESDNDIEMYLACAVGILIMLLIIFLP